MAATDPSDGTIINAAAAELPLFATRHANLASADFGAKVLDCTDEFFAKSERMLQASEPVFVVGKFDDHGKWMDGWETRRRRNGGHDTAVIRLGMPGIIKGLDIDTSHFTGNYPPAASVQVCHVQGDPDDSTVWTELVPASSLSGNAHHFIDITDTQVWTHLRLHIYPDGGVARLRVYGQPACDWSQYDADALHEVSALHHGGRIVAYNNAHYGTPFRLIMPGRGVNMGDGWETRRRREPGYDWCIIELGHAATIEKIEIDTAHFKGNYPDRVSVQGARMTASTDESLITQAMFWPALLAEQKTEADAQHFFEGNALRQCGPVTHVRVNMFPDGGISRVRLWGRLAV
ncbi:allantoicase [Pollutimonas harenae]|uniref:Probable allantoicase n=1 Tax=Pollutimonas harenae TaxID=657015 RepID=A0A853GNF0_9BURK|nr:allantoicase [Pollutimonas harenae]NYT84548.1 allantoicase [Pollutimonas harenae]TEA73058.1 allantoicase [Pollutimonas harenae]